MTEMKRAMALSDFHALKSSGKRFALLTAYDASTAALFSSAGIEMLLVGDSLGVVIQGNDTTVPVTLDDMLYHTKMVARGNQGSFIVADMPFMTYSTPLDACNHAAQLMQAGAQAVKLEGGAWLADTVRLLAERGIPVCAHLGLTPQSVHKLSGYSIQCRQQSEAEQLMQDAQTLTSAGADFVLLECLPSGLAANITTQLAVPVIGVGAGPGTDAQGLVSHDVLGMTVGPVPKFAKNYLSNTNSVQRAVAAYAQEVRDGVFPDQSHSYR